MRINIQAAPANAGEHRGETHEEGRGFDRRAMVGFNDTASDDGPLIVIVTEHIVAERRLAVARRIAERAREAKRTARLLGADDDDLR